MNTAIKEEDKEKQEKEKKKPLTIEEKVKKLNKEQEQLDARRKSILAKSKQEDLKFQNRRKYIMGSLFLKDIETNIETKEVAIRLLTILNEKDKKYFSDLLIPAIKEVKTNLPILENKEVKTNLPILENREVKKD